MKFLFCSLNTPGFLYPAIGIAKTLRSRGHQVAFAADISCREILASHRFDRISRGKTDGNSFLVEQWGVPLSIAIQSKHVEYALSCFQPDVLVGQQLTLGPLLVSERRQLPIAILGFCTYLWPVQTVRRDYGPKWHARVRWRYQDLIETFDAARKLAGLPPSASNPTEPVFLGDLFILRSVPELEQNADGLPKRVRLAGACIWDEVCEDYALDAWLEDARASNRPVVYVQQGRTFHLPSFWALLVEALADSDISVVASVGRIDCNLGDIPSNFFVRPHVPQSAVLNRSMAVVCSANTTAVLGALTAGVPCLLIPAGGEQPDVAEHCVVAEVAGAVDPGELSAKGLRVHLDRLLADGTIKQCAREMALAFSRVDSFPVVADLLEGLAVRSCIGAWPKQN